MIDLLWTGLAGLSGAEIGMIGAWIADRGRKRRPWMLRYCVGLGFCLGAAMGALVTMPRPADNRLDKAGPVFAAIRDHFPGAFEQMSAAAKDVDHADSVALQTTLTRLIDAHRAEMDDDSAAAVGQLMLDETAALKDAKPEACVAALDGKPVGLDLRTVESPELRRRDAEVTAQLVQQVATRPAAPPKRLTADESERIGNYALGKLTSGDRDTIAPLLLDRRGPQTTREAAAWCAFQRARIAAAMDAPQGTLRRFLGG